MMQLYILLVVMMFVLGIDCFRCPNHCFCYMWGNLLRTDCVRRNLFNTFLGFSHQTQVLDLSYNVMSILHGNEFLDANLRQLQDLRLSNNRLHKIDKLSFNGLQLLESLDLSFNSIEYLNPITFKYNPNLKTLNVSFNPLGLKREESFLFFAPSLQVLDMASCHLEYVSHHSFLDLKRLGVLNISRNHIRKIELEFLDGMKSLKYLDVSKNDLCNDLTKTLLHSLAERNIQYQAFCTLNQKMLVIPVIEAKETNNLERESYQRNFKKNLTQQFLQDKNIFEYVTELFQSIPSFYAIICGIHIGIFLGAFSTYFCLRKSIRSHTTNQERNARERTSATALIPLNTPPGTPPSPYHSRFFPSNFTLSSI